MPIVRAALLTFLFVVTGFGIAGTARAQNVASMRLQQVAQQKLPGATATMASFGGLLSKKQSSSQSVTLAGGRCYTLLGTGGDGVKDVDLYIYDGANKKVASDLGFDALPALTYCPRWPGPHRLEIVLKDGGGEVAAQLFVQPKASTPNQPAAPPTNAKPDAITAMIEQSALAGTRRVGDFFRGAGKEDEHGDFTVSLEAAHCYSFYGAAGSGVTALSLYLWDPSDKRVADEKSGTPAPVLRYCPQVGGPFHVQGKVAKGAGEYRVAVYEHPGQEEPGTVGTASPVGGDPLAAMVKQLSTQVAPGYVPVGELFRGAGSKNSHTDWTVALGQGRCYTFIGLGGAGVEQLSLYAWDPSGKRVADRRSNNSQSVMGICATMPGPYHLQGKIEKGAGEYRMGVYGQ